MTPRTGLTALALLLSAAAPAVAQDHDARVARVLKATPLIDGHNDWAEAQRNVAGDARWTLDLRQLDPAKYNTDIARLRRGKVGGQFRSVYSREPARTRTGQGDARADRPRSPMGCALS